MMQHEELLRQLEQYQDKRFNQIELRLEAIEDKIDYYTRETVKNGNDLAWVKGSVKLIIPFILGIVSSIIALFLEQPK